MFALLEGLAALGLEQAWSGLVYVCVLPAGFLSHLSLCCHDRLAAYGAGKAWPDQASGVPVYAAS